MTGANAAWQFGLSASAPLLMATPGHFLEKSIGILPLSTTIWSPAAIIHEVAFIVALILFGCWLMPKHCRPLSLFPDSMKVAEAPAIAEPPAMTTSEQLERKPYFTLVLCVILAAWLYYHFGIKRLSLDINSLNTTLLLVSFLLHRNFKSFTRALEKAVVAAWPVIVLYHLYAGLAGLIQFTTVGERAGRYGCGDLESVHVPAAYGVHCVGVFVLHPFERWTVGDTGIHHDEIGGRCRGVDAARPAGDGRGRSYGESHVAILVCGDRRDRSHGLPGVLRIWAAVRGPMVPDWSSGVYACAMLSAPPTVMAYCRHQSRLDGVILDRIRNSVRGPNRGSGTRYMLWKEIWPPNSCPSCLLSCY